MKMVPKLSSTEHNAWRAYWAATSLLTNQLDQELQRDGGLPHAYYEILLVLADAPDLTLRMSDLANLTQFSRSRLSHAVARLEQSGWVERHSCPTDKRGSFATLTTKGEKVLSAATPGHIDAVRRHLIDLLTPEQVQQLAAISSVVSEHLIEEMGIRGSCPSELLAAAEANDAETA